MEIFITNMEEETQELEAMWEVAMKVEKQGYRGTEKREEHACFQRR